MIKLHVLKLKMLSHKLIIFLFVTTFAINYNSKAQNTEKFRVVIDVAHGGRDVGSEAFGVKEKNVVLKVALFIEEILSEREDIELILTRRDDAFVSLKERTEIANDTNANLFISLHSNASEDESLFGAESFVLGLPRFDKDQTIAIQENSVIKLEDNYFEKYNWFDPKSPEYYNNFRFVKQKYLDKSQFAATLIQNNFKSNFGRKDRGVHEANFIILKDLNMPGVVVQLGYLSNFKEHYFLMLSNNQKKYAQEICNAILQFKSSKNFDIKDMEIEDVINEETKNIVENQSDTIDKNKTIYYVQILSTRKYIVLNPENFNGLEGVSKITEDGFFKYRYGQSESLEEISEFLKKSKEKGYNDAFIVAYSDGKKIPLSQPKKETTHN